MPVLTPDESRVLGVLIEKELTTPDQYPLTLNAVVSGANQKSNRDPVLAMTDDQARAALISLRGKGLVVQLDGHGQRTSKYRHEAHAKLPATRAETALLAELLLRGPQTLGELRGRASRMFPLESLEVARNTLEQLMARAEPLVARVAPSPGSRAERYAQLLCPDLHPSDPEVSGESSDSDELPGDVHPDVSADAESIDSLKARITVLESQVSTLRSAIVQLAQQTGADVALLGLEAVDGPH